MGEGQETQEVIFEPFLNPLQRGPAMTTRAVALLSGGLDSMLAIRAMQDQGIEIEAINLQTMFSCCKNTAAQAADRLNVPLTVLRQEDDYLDIIRRPRHGYGKGVNPCVDCRIYMFQRARHMMDEVGASMVISGEVVGQRPMSQKRRDLEVIARASGLDDRLLRPLSAHLLPPTRPERTGEVDRSQLFSFSGRGRKGLIALARHYQFDEIPSPSTGCALAETSFAGKVRDLLVIDARATRWDFELLKVGRHIRIDRQTKAIVGRRAEENQALADMYRQTGSRASAMLVPNGFPGPTVLVVGPPLPATLQLAGGLVMRYAKYHDEQPAIVACHVGTQTHAMQIDPHPLAATAATL